MQSLNNIRLSLSSVAPILITKLIQYAEILDSMDSNNGWYEFPNDVLDYFHALDVCHWAELYFPAGAIKFIETQKENLVKFNQIIIDEIGENPTPEAASSFLNKLAEYEGDIVGLEFLEEPANVNLAKNLSEDESKSQQTILITYLVNFYNDLSIAAHRESIYSLVARAEANDYDAVIKAIQIDPTIIHYFNKVIMDNSLKGNSNFFDALSYRIKNSPRRGANKHPLLWILMKDLYSFNCLHKSIKSHHILTIYQDALGGHPKFSIDDDQVVQRQRRQFNQMYRLVK